MEHCQKLGKGRSPPVRTLEEWDWLRKEVHAITPDISVMGTIWLAATDQEVEGEWRDAYPPYDQLNTSLPWPWKLNGKDSQEGDTHNCMVWQTSWSYVGSWVEAQCKSYNRACLKDVS